MPELILPGSPEFSEPFPAPEGEVLSKIFSGDMTGRILALDVTRRPGIDRRTEHTGPARGEAGIAGGENRPSGLYDLVSFYGTKKAFSGTEKAHRHHGYGASVPLLLFSEVSCPA